MSILSVEQSPIDLESGFGFFRGRVALAAMLRTIGVKTGDKVMIPGYSCSALAEGVFATGAIPIYVDIEEQTYNICAKDAENKIESGVKALVVQHTYGIPASMDDICRLASKNNLPFIEDCCHTLASRWDKKLIGTFGRGAFFSFEAGKPITTGIGGWAQMTEESDIQLLKKTYSQYAQPSSFVQARIKLMRLAINTLYRPSTYWPIKRLYNFLQDIGILNKTFNDLKPDQSEKALSEEGFAEFWTQLGKTQVNDLELALTRYLLDIDRRKDLAQYAIEQFEHLGLKGMPMLEPKANPILMRVPVHVADKTEALRKSEADRVELSDNYVSPVHPYQGAELNKVKYELGSCPVAEKISQCTVSVPIVARTSHRDIDKAARLLKSCQ